MKTKFVILKQHKMLFAGMFVLLLLATIISLVLFYNKHTLRQTNDTYTHEVGTSLILKPADFFDTTENNAAQITFDVSAVDPDTVGEYTATAYFKKASFDLKISVVDTAAPIVKLKKRYIFTNDINHASLEHMIENVSEYSKWSARLIRFEKQGNLETITQNTLQALTDQIPIPCDSKELASLGTEEPPTEEGIYRAVMELCDIYGNSRLEEIYVIYDTTGAYIDDTPDKTIYVEASDLNKEPEINKADYHITDNVDGIIAEKDIFYKLELHDAKKHEWLVQVSYTDRAGNNSHADFLLIVKEKEVESSHPMVDTDNPTVNTSNNETTDTTNFPQSLANKRNPSEQQLLAAGVGTVVSFKDGTYGVIMPTPEHLIHGKRGNEILRDYLAELGLEGSIQGGWLPNADYYCFTAKNIHEILSQNDEEFWD